MKMRSKLMFLVFLVIVEISYVLGDDQRYDDAHGTHVDEHKSHTDHLLQSDDGRGIRRKGRTVVKRRHAMRNRRDWVDQYNNPYYSQDSSSRQNNQQQPQNQQPQYQPPQNQQPQNYNYQQPQNQQPQNYNYQQPQNQQPQYQQPQNYNYQQPQNQQPQNYNYPPPQLPFSIPFQNPASPQQPHINNYYYPSSVPNVQYYPPYVSPYPQQPMTVGPFIIIQVPYCPSESKPTPTQNKTILAPRIDVDKANETSLVDYKAYNRTKTGVSLERIPPIRNPTVTFPPLFREDDDDVNEDNLAPISAPRATTTTTRTPLRTRRPPTTTTTTEAYDEGDVYEDSENACASAIVRCCTPNMDMRCFEKSKCPFIFDDPCEELKQAANNIAKQKAMWN